MTHNKSEIPDKRELIIAKGSQKGYQFVCIGVFRIQNNRKHIVTMTGNGYAWCNVSSWAYMHDVLPEYDVWGPAATPASVIGLTLDEDDSEAYSEQAN